MAERASGIVEYVSRAKRLLTQARTAEEVRQVLDLAAFAAELGRRIGAGTGAVNEALLFRAKAMRKLADVVDEGQAKGEIAGHGGDRSKVRAPDVAPLPVAKQRLDEARRIRDAFTDDDLERRFAEASAGDRELPTSRLIAEAKHGERETGKRERERSRAAMAPEVAELTACRWEEWLPAQPICDLLLTDPPYSTDIEDIRAFAAAWLPVALAKVKRTGRAYVCIGAYPAELAAYLAVPPPADITLVQVLVWTYRNTLGPSPSHDYKLNWQAVLYYRGLDAPPLDAPEMVEQFSVQDVNAPDGRHGDRWHAWQKPDALAERRLMPVESAAAKDMTTDLDVLAGIDAWQMLDSEGVMRGIASRVQWGPDSWRTFTIRRERPTGTPTELAKRLRAIDNPREGWLLPALTIQAYLTKPKPGGSLIEAAVVRTMDLYAYAQMNPCTKPRQNPADGVWFDWYRWDALRRVGCQVGTVVGTRQHLDDGLFPRPDGGPI